jgi:hypothetical protein
MEEGLNLERLLHRRQRMQEQLQDLQGKIDKIESNHLSRWHSGNYYLSFDPQIGQAKRKVALDVPSHAKLFSTSDAASPVSLDLDFRNKRIVPLEV